MTFAHVYDQALRSLARRAHGERELADKLLAKGAEPETVAQVMERCRELGLLDDKSLAEDFTRYRLNTSHHGPWRIKADLRRKGVAEETIQEAITTSTAGLDLVALARETLDRRFGPPPDDAEHAEERGEALKLLRRKYDFLARRGFSSETIRQALNRDFTD